MEPLPTDEWEAEQLEGVDPSLIMQAKIAEMQQLQDRATFEIRPRSELGEDMKIVGTRWVLVNKGTQTEPKIKARLVAQEFANDRSLDFSAAPQG